MELIWHLLGRRPFHPSLWYVMSLIANYDLLSWLVLELKHSRRVQCSRVRHISLQSAPCRDVLVLLY